MKAPSEVSLAELFARDPRDQSDEYFAEIVKRLRQDRHKFLSEGTRSLPAPKSAASSEVARLNLDIKL